jgi:hypothetical protein
MNSFYIAINQNVWSRRRQGKAEGRAGERSE